MTRPSKRDWIWLGSGLAAGVVLGIVLAWLIRSPAPPVARLDAAAKAKAESGIRSETRSAARSASSEDRTTVNLPSDPARSTPPQTSPAYVEQADRFQRHLALADGAIMSAIRQAGLSETAVRFNRITNVAAKGIQYEQAEIGLDLGSVSPERFSRLVTEALERLGVPAGLMSVARDGEGERLEIWLDDRLTHGLDLTPSRSTGQASPPKESTPQTETGPLPRAVIIIDDLGWHPQGDRALINLNLPLTLSILPFGPVSARSAEETAAAGKEVMVHLPMEPTGYPEVNPGPGALLTGQSEAEFKRRLKDNLDQVPEARGANNHMGSRLTARKGPMKLIMTELKKRNMFFIDSLTSSDSLAGRAARQVGTPFGSRQVFLDNTAEPAAIAAQLARLIARARQDGLAVAIGHPYPQTAAALLDWADRLTDQVRLVPASQAATVQ